MSARSRGHETRRGARSPSTAALSAAQGGSRFKIVPDPPEAGRPAEVTYVGPASTVEWQVDGNDPVSVNPDANGKFTIDPVPSGADLWLSDNLGLPGYLHRPIIDLDNG